MKTYIGTKIIKAEFMTHHIFLAEKGMGTDGEDAHGYKVVYPDGYVSWSPKEVFEVAYREITSAEIDLIQNQN